MSKTISAPQYDTRIKFHVRSDLPFQPCNHCTAAGLLKKDMPYVYMGQWFSITVQPAPQNFMGS